MNDKTLLISQQNHVATLTLNRPQVHNALDIKLINALKQTLTDLEEDSQTRVIVLKAAGKNFCAGADLNWMKQLTQQESASSIETVALSKLLQQLYHYPKPTIAIIQGATLGGGIGLVACCDIVLASEEAYFTFSEVKLGLIPAIISPYVIRAIGARQANRYFLSAERFSANTAQQLNLIHEVLPTQQLLARVDKLTTQLIQNAPHALTASKQLVQAITSDQYDSADLIVQLDNVLSAPETKIRLGQFFKEK